MALYAWLAGKVVDSICLRLAAGNRGGRVRPLTSRRGMLVVLKSCRAGFGSLGYHAVSGKLVRRPMAGASAGRPPTRPPPSVSAPPSGCRPPADPAWPTTPIPAHRTPRADDRRPVEDLATWLPETSRMWHCSGPSTNATCSAPVNEAVLETGCAVRGVRRRWQWLIDVADGSVRPCGWSAQLLHLFRAKPAVGPGGAYLT